MIITVNGDATELEGATTVAALLTRLDLDGKRVVVERNEAIVPKAAYNDEALTDGDVVEIIQFVPGG